MQIFKHSSYLPHSFLLYTGVPFCASAIFVLAQKHSFTFKLCKIWNMLMKLHFCEDSRFHYPLTHIHTYMLCILLYMYIHLCVCVCVLLFSIVHRHCFFRSISFGVICLTPLSSVMTLVGSFLDFCHNFEKRIMCMIVCLWQNDKHLLQF